MNPEQLAAAFAALEERRNILVLDAPEDEDWQTTSGAEPLQVRLHYDRGRLVYEARVPLEYRGYPPYEIDLDRGTLGLALRVPVPQRGEGRGGFRGGSGGPGGGRGGIAGMSGGRRGGGFGGARGGGGMPAVTLELWTRGRLTASGG